MGLSILVVDDAAFMRRVIRSALEAGGYDNIREAEDGVGALKEYRKNRPDLVLLDITMPGKTGLEVLSDILETDKTAKVIMCSAVGQEPVIAQAIRRGACDFIMKPFQRKELLKLVEAVAADV